MAQIDYAKVVSFLEDPASHTPIPDRIERLETHGALIFLAGAFALKIKKPVVYAYMDFSSLDRRRRACQRELEINRPHAPEIYLDVVAVTLEPGGELAIDGIGEPVEWCVRMRRFPQSDVLAEIADARSLDKELCHALAHVVAEYHHDAPVIDDLDNARRMATVADDICRQLESLSPDLSADEVQSFRALVNDHLDRVGAALSARGRGGFVRRVHGDLHLGNIVLWRGKPVLFDAIEFDESLATIDTLYDLAFLLMDLDHRGQRAAANLVMNRYLHETNDIRNLRGLAALPLFVSLRAAVRALVMAQRAAQASNESGAPRVPHAGMDQAKNYLRQALTALAPRQAMLVAVGGLSGSGKSTLAAGLAPRLGASPGAVHLRSDLERKAMFNCAEAERLPPAAYSPEVGLRVYDALLEKAEATLRAGRDVIVDAVFARAGERMAIEQAATRTGVTFQGVWLEAPAAVLRARVEHRSGDASDATTEVVDQQLTLDTGPITWTHLTSDRPQEALCDEALIVVRQRSDAD